MHTCKNRNIDAVIVHSVFNAAEGDKYDVDLVIKQFSRYRVSSHYIIGRDGTIYQLVNEKNISYQAGHSQLPDGRTGGKLMLNRHRTYHHKRQSGFPHTNADKITDHIG